MTRTHLMACAATMALSVVSSTGCPCPAIYYPDHITLEFSEPLTTSGTLVLTTVRDGYTDVCELEYAGIGGPGNCTADGECWSGYESKSTDSCTWRSVEWSGRGPDKGTLDTLFLEYWEQEPPSNFEVRIERDGVVIASTSYALDITADYPSGFTCGSRYSTFEELEITSP